jgi:hypothetical protein
MLNLLDQTILAVLDQGWTATPPPDKPGFFFTVPDEDWRTTVKQGVGERLNIYLYEFRENREYRRAEWDAITLSDRTTVLSHPPAYFDCHYLISAWSPVEDSEATSPVLEEHQVLGEALRVLLRAPEIRPIDFGIVGGGQVFEQAQVCLTIAPPEAPRVLNDFWSTMKLPWRPAIQLVATAPIDLLQDSAPAPAMTTFVQRYVISSSFGADEVIQIGGWVLNTLDDSPIAGATVTRLDTGAAVVTDVQGRFTFAGLRRGVHRFRAEKPPLAADEHDVDVPAGSPDSHIFRLS